jgi:hypothetical protein
MYEVFNVQTFYFVTFYMTKHVAQQDQYMKKVVTEACFPLISLSFSQRKTLLKNLILG